MKNRYYLIDGLRGLTVVSMVLYHFSYNVFMIYGINPHWVSIPAVYYWQQSICWSFIFISGFVWSWGREKNLKRGLMLNAFGFVITAVTLIVLPSEAIWFGVLNFIGCAVLLMLVFEKPAMKIRPVLGLFVSFLLFMLFKRVNSGEFGIYGLFTLRLPQALYDIKILTPLGFPFPGFRSSDYFSILPWFFLYLCGFFFSRIFREHENWQESAKLKIPVFSAIGTKALWIYLLHQPVCMLICMIIFGN